MFSGTSAWDLASVLGKVFVYLGFVSLVGGCFILLITGNSPQQSEEKTARKQIVITIFIASVLGFIAAGIYFLLQVGVINNEGITGMFDRTLAAFLLETNVGDASVLRLGGFFLALMASFLYLRQLLGVDALDDDAVGATKKNHRLSIPGLILILYCLAAASLIGSFARIGHVAALDALARISIMIHVLAISLWVGSLLPLRLLVGKIELVELKRLMILFGKLAVIIVAVILLSGGLLIVQLLESWLELFNTAYGQLLLIKITVVALLLSVGAANKLYFVPRLTDDYTTLKLKRAISAEMLLVLVIVLITAYVSTALGAEH